MQLQLQRLASDYAQGDRLAAFGALLLLLQLQSSPAAALLAAGRPAAAQGMVCTCFACASPFPNLVGTSKAQHFLFVNDMALSCDLKGSGPIQCLTNTTL